MRLNWITQTWVILGIIIDIYILAMGRILRISND